MGEGIVREFGMDTYRVLYLKWITNKDILYSTANSVQCYVAAWMGSLREMDTCICMAESLCCPPETITALLIGYTPIQNKKVLKNKIWEKKRMFLPDKNTYPQERKLEVKD